MVAGMVSTAVQVAQVAGVVEIMVTTVQVLPVKAIGEPN
jgi:hypothetical protein